MSRVERPVLEVEEVEPHEVVEAEVRAAGDLPEAGHARQHEVALAVPALEPLEVAQRQRPRADEAHLAAQDVPELRDLVEREPAQHRADGRHARVLADLEERPVGLVRGLELGLLDRRVGAHGAELQHPELLLAEADAPVAVEHGPARVELHRGGDPEPERQPDEQHEAGDEQVEDPLHDPVHPDERGRPQLEQRDPLARHELDARGQQLGGLRRDPHLDAAAVGVVDDLQQLALAEVRVGHDQLVHALAVEHRRQVVQVAEHGQPDPVRRGRDRADELVVDPAAARSRARRAGARRSRPSRRAARSGARRACAAPRR